MEPEQEAMWEYCPRCGYQFEGDSLSCAHCDTHRGFISGPSKPKWEKCLWKRQPEYEDNYSDPVLFLQGLKRNINVVEYEFWEVVVDSSVITGQLTTVTLYLTVFLYLQNGLLDLTLLALLLLFFLVVGFALMVAMEYSDWTWDRLFLNLKSLAIVFGAVYTLSPILATLTEPLSDTTLTTYAVICFLVHLFSQDYAYLAGLSDTFTAPVSLNAAIFACVIDCSRLLSASHVFVIISLTIELFALFPVLRRSILVYSIKANMALTWTMFFFVAWALSYINSMFTSVYVAAVIFITLVCPYWLIRIQKYKNTIHGPWDEAVPSSSVMLFKG